MPTLPKAKKTKSSKLKGSAIDSAQRELLERQNEIQAQIDAIQRSIEQAPERQAEQARRDRETFVGTATRPRYIHGATVADARRVTVVGVPARRPAPKRPTMLRAERIAARRQTVALLVVLAAAVIYALSHLLP